MQKMFLKHMETDDSQSEGGVKTSRSFERAASRDDGGKASREEKTIVTGAEKRRVVEPPRRRSSAVNKWREDGQEDQDEYDRQFLKNLKEVTDKFVSAGKETRQISEEAANNVNAEASRLDRTEHEEEEEEVEGQDELDEDKITGDEVQTYQEVCRSWMKRICKHVVSSIVFDSNLVLQVSEPHQGTMWKKGLTRADIEARILKISVRCKALVSSIHENCNKDQLPEPLVSFFQRLVKHHQLYPTSHVAGKLHMTQYLYQIEEKVLNIPAGSNRAG
mmetsp:Transcript_3844/g.13851  ORF Transcript_3844/g.13851 Transcript_3844/m.13851 type:complete len:276 (-) Transcript_3844:113-940(-)